MRIIITWPYPLMPIARRIQVLYKPIAVTNNLKNTKHIGMI